MCEGCYEEYGRPRIVTSATKAAAEAIAEVYEHSCVGGNLHIVLDDWNIEDDHLASCREAIERVKGGKPEHYDDLDPEQVAAEDACLKLLEPMTIDERASALAIYDGYIAGANGIST